MSVSLQDGLCTAAAYLDEAVENLIAAQHLLADMKAPNWADEAQSASFVANELAKKAAGVMATPWLSAQLAIASRHLVEAVSHLGSAGLVLDEISAPWSQAANDAANAADELCTVVKRAADALESLGAGS